jgi:hypothetical protein
MQVAEGPPPSKQCGLGFHEQSLRSTVKKHDVCTAIAARARATPTALLNP